MAIQISENGRLFTLHTKNSSYQMFADPFGTLLHLYYGKRTDGENLSDLIFRTDMGFSGNPPEAGSDRTYSLDYLRGRKLRRPVSVRLIPGVERLLFPSRHARPL